jgi:Zn-dependent protease with chaperone function/Tfp pilus assembly protein PilF
MSRKSISLTLVITVCLSLAARGFLMPAYDEQSTKPQSPARLAVIYRLRGSLWLQKHEPQKALADFDAALRFNASEIAARYGRAECYRQLGDFERANAEMPQKSVTIDLGAELPGLKDMVSVGTNIVALFSTPTGVWLLVAITWVLLSTINAIVGWRQTSEASGSLWRLCYVAAGLGVFEVLPLGVWAALLDCNRANSMDWRLVLGLTFLSLIATFPMLHPPVRLRGARNKLPRVDDEVFLSRIAELARSMNVPVPLVRLLPSVTGSQRALAFVGCLPAPQMVVSDGILHRLSPVERDAVVAHELGHLANGSLWLLTAVIPVTCAVVIGVSAWVPLTVAIPFGLALVIGLRRIVSRPLELDADLRAARAIGFRDTATALAKIHAVNSFGSGLMPLLIYATAAHPSREMRLWSLQEAAPDCDISDIKVAPETVRKHRTAATIAFLVWLLTLVATLTAALATPDLPFLTVPLWIAVLTPTALLLVARRRQNSISRRRLGTNWVQTVPLVVALAASTFLAIFPHIVQKMTAPRDGDEGIEYFLLYPLLVAVSCLAAGAVMRRSQASRKLRGEMSIAFQVHDFVRVLEIGRSAPATVARDPWLRYHIALARALCDDRTAAIAEFEAIWRDAPAFPIAAITLSALLLDVDQPERALEVAHSVALRLPRDAATHLLVARSLRRLGRLDEAQRACERALGLEPAGGIAQSVAAAIALDRGDFVRAQQLIDTACEFAPGEAYVLLVKAELALKTQSYGNPSAVADAAFAAVRANPFALYQADVTRLTRSMVGFESSSVKDELVLATVAAS